MIAQARDRASVIAERAVARRVLPSLIGNDRLQVMAALAASTPAGVFVEVGVYKGGSLDVLYRVMQEQKDLGRQVFAFDSFEGMPVKSEIDRHEIGDFADCDERFIAEVLPGVHLTKGVFPESLKFDLDDIAFVHADVDQYETTKAVILGLGPKMVRGGLMLFDDYIGLPGCIQAVDQFAPQREILPDGRALVRF